MQQSLTNNSGGTQLQPQGSNNVQSVQGGLQTQATTQNQSATQPQQDVLGPQDYYSYDKLTVQGVPANNPTSITTGKGSLEVFIALLLVFILCAILLLRHFLRAKSKSDIVADTKPAFIAESPVIFEEKSAKKHHKKHKPNNKVVKKSKARAKKKR